MNVWKLALVGFSVVSVSAIAAPSVGGSAAAVKAAMKLSVIPNLGGEEIIVLTNKVTGEVSVEGPNGEIVATTDVPASDVQQANCGYGGCGYGPGGPGLVYGGGQLGYGYPVAPPVVVQESEIYERRVYKRRAIIAPVQPYGYGGGYGGPGYGGPGYGGGYGGPDVGYGDGGY